MHPTVRLVRFLFHVTWLPCYSDLIVFVNQGIMWEICFWNHFYVNDLMDVWTMLNSIQILLDLLDRNIKILNIHRINKIK